MKKVLFVIRELGIGGTENSLVSLLNLIDYTKYSVDVMVHDDMGYYRQFIPKEVNVIRFRKKDDIMLSTLKELKNEKTINYFFIKKLCISIKYFFIKKINKNYKPMDSILRQISMYEKSYDIAISYDSRYMQYIKEKIKATKYISWYHFSYNFTNKNKLMQDEYLFGLMDYIVLVSHTCKMNMDNIFPKLNSKFVYIPNSLNYEQILKKSNEFIPDEYNTTYTICSVGRLEKQKNFELAIKACKIIKNTNLNFKWFIIGDGNDRGYLQKLIDTYQLNDTIFLLGKKVNPYPYIKNSSLYVQTSIFEGLCIAVAEALSLNVPIVVTNIVGLKEYVNSENGFISEMNEYDVSTKIITALNDLENFNAQRYKPKDDTYKLFINLVEGENNFE